MSQPKRYIVSEAFPPRGRGGPLIAARIATGLAEAGWDIRAITEGRRTGLFCRWEYDPPLFERVRRRMEIEVVGRFRWGVVGEVLVTLGLSPSLRMDWVRQVRRRAGRLIDPAREGILLALFPDIASLAAALELRRRFGLPMVLDLRDDFKSHCTANRRLARRLRDLEQRALAAAEHVTVTTETVRRSLRERFGCPDEKITVMHNGYGEAVDAGAYPVERDRPFRVVYAGSIAHYEKPEVLNLAYRRLMERRPELRGKIEIEVFGQRSHHYRRVYRRTLCEGIRFHGFVPFEELVRRTVGRVDVGFLAVDDAGAYSMHTKLFDYVNFELPILGALPEGEAKGLIEKYDIGKVAHHSDIDGLAGLLYELYANPAELCRLAANVRRVKPQFSMTAQVGRLDRVLRQVRARVPAPAEGQVQP